MIRPAVVVLIAAAACAQQPAIENAKVESHAFSGSLAAQFAQFGAGAFWAGYSEAAIPGQQGNACCSDDGCRGYANGTPVRLEGQTALVILVRMEAGRVGKLRVVSPDCKLDGGGLPFHWVNGVPADASVNWLKSQAAGDHMNEAVFAIAMHNGAAADQVLGQLSAPGENEKIREKTAFWSGTLRGAKGIELLKRMLVNDPADQVREQVVFALSRSTDPAGIKALIDAARNDVSPHVRGRALFWLAQKAGDKEAADVIAADVINDKASNDADRSVKESAVFALKQLPPNQGIPLLINLARTNADPNVRKKALFWLGQSDDPWALEFITQVLQK
jgi:hypothetical protein